MLCFDFGCLISICKKVKSNIEGKHSNSYVKVSFHVGLSVHPSIDFVVRVFSPRVTSTLKSEERGRRWAEIIDTEIEYFCRFSGVRVLCRNASGLRT